MPFLHGRFEHKYLETPDFQMVSLPYHGKHFQFIVLLPKEKLGLDDIIENLRARQLHKWFNSMAYESVKVGRLKLTPRGSFRSTCLKLNLKPE